MTQEEITAKLEVLEARNAALEAKNAELDAKVNPPIADPDLAYKPSTWKENRETTEKIANDTALKVLQDAEKKKDDLKKQQEDEIAAEGVKIEAAFKKLEESKELEPTNSPDDLGGQQRKQILGALVSVGGKNIDKAFKLAKSAWDQGLELDFDPSTAEVKLVRAGNAPSSNRNQIVGSSANRTPTTPAKGQVNLVGANGDLDEIQARWEAANSRS